MKYFVKIFVITFFLLISTNSFAEQKIVVLDLKFVLNNSKAGKGAQDYLKKSFEENQKKFTKMEKDLKKEEIDLLEKKTILTKEEYNDKTDSLRKKVIDYQSQRRASLDKLAKQRATARKILTDKLNPILDSYINENEISLVIDKKNMVGGLNEYDITNLIVDKLNKEFPSINLE